MFREGGDVVIPLADVTITCESDITHVNGDPIDPTNELEDYPLGDGESVTVTVDTTLGTSSCSAEEDIDQSGVESSANEACTDENLDAGEDALCIFTNTVFFEGIPTLSQYGLAILALLMLGVGFVGLRRFV